MTPIKKILACIDFSDYSLMTMEHAVALASMAQAQIVVLNVVNQRDITGVEALAPYFPSNVVVDEYVEDMKKHRLDQMKQLVREHFFQDKSLMTMKIEVGFPPETILKVIRKEDVDLVVMGNKGRSNLTGFLFGSSAEKVFRHSPVPVLSVRDRSNFKRS